MTKEVALLEQESGSSFQRDDHYSPKPLSRLSPNRAQGVEESVQLQIQSGATASKIESPVESQIRFQTLQYLDELTSDFEGFSSNIITAFSPPRSSFSEPSFFLEASGIERSPQSCGRGVPLNDHEDDEFEIEARNGYASDGEGLDDHVSEDRGLEESISFLISLGFGASMSPPVPHPHPLPLRPFELGEDFGTSKRKNIRAYGVPEDYVSEEEDDFWRGVMIDGCKNKDEVEEWSSESKSGSSGSSSVVLSPGHVSGRRPRVESFSSLKTDESGSRNGSDDHDSEDDADSVTRLLEKIRRDKEFEMEFQRLRQRYCEESDKEESETERLVRELVEVGDSPAGSRQ
jgi:hypothetical protein